MTGPQGHNRETVEAPRGRGLGTKPKGKKWAGHVKEGNDVQTEMTPNASLRVHIRLGLFKEQKGPEQPQEVI